MIFPGILLGISPLMGGNCLWEAQGPCCLTEVESISHTFHTDIRVKHEKTGESRRKDSLPELRFALRRTFWVWTILVATQHMATFFGQSTRAVRPYLDGLGRIAKLVALAVDDLQSWRWWVATRVTNRLAICPGPSKC